MANASSRSLIVVSVLLSAGAPAAAQLAGPTLTNPQAGVPGKKAPVAEKAKACPEYGAGYKRLDNGTCVKIGGYVRYQAQFR